jgi:hypothetical protein
VEAGSLQLKGGIFGSLQLKAGSHSNLKASKCYRMANSLQIKAESDSRPDGRQVNLAMLPPKHWQIRQRRTPTHSLSI